MKASETQSRGRVRQRSARLRANVGGAYLSRNRANCDDDDVAEANEEDADDDDVDDDDVADENEGEDEDADAVWRNIVILWP